MTLKATDMVSELLIDQTDTLGNLADSVSDLTVGIKSSQISKERQEILDWLSEHQYDAQYRRGYQLHCSNTCTWLLYHTRFQQWNETRSSLLWMHGQAGSGKTVATSYLIHHLSDHAETDRNQLAYFYYDASTIESLTPETFFGAIIKQFCAQMKQVPQEIVDAYQRAKLREGTPKQSSLGELKQFLRSILSSQDSSVIIIDGLDESPEYGQVCDFLASAVESGQYPLRVFISSRPEVDIRRRLGQFQEIAVPENAIENDIGVYIQMRILADPRLRRMSDKMKHYVEETLRTDSHGMSVPQRRIAPSYFASANLGRFRWVQCQLDAISRLRTDAAVKRALSQLPPSLEGSYVRILENIDPSDVKYAKRTLIWLAHAANPLSLAELTQAVVLDPDFRCIDPDSMLNDPNDVLEICGSLITFNTASRTTRIAHHSVREFLTERLSETSEFSIPTASSHRLIAEVCISYLLLEDFKPGPLRIEELRWTIKNHPLLRYAAQNWPFHVQMSGAEVELQPLILKLTTPHSNPNFLFWLQVVFFDSKHGYIPPTSELGRARALYYATSYGLTETVRSLIGLGANLNERAGRFGGTALHAAVWRRRPEILELLDKAGADASIKDFNGSTPPDLAMWAGNQGLYGKFLKKSKVDDRTADLLKRVLDNRENALAMTNEEWALAYKYHDQQQDDVRIETLFSVINKTYAADNQEADGKASKSVKSHFDRRNLPAVPQSDIANAKVVGGGERFELG